MKKKYITYKQNGTLKKAVLDENMLRTYKTNPDITNLNEYENEVLMEKAFSNMNTSTKGKKRLLG